MLANPTGKFELGGPHADAGLTGRKIIVDTYGGAARHGGGAFSGKDPSKVDRSAAYAARWLAKHVVASGAAKRCEIQVAYAIGVARPVSLLVETFGTAQVDPARIEKAINEVFDLRPAAIIRDLDLRRPIYRKTAAYGHFGRSDKEFSWEQVSRLDEFNASARGLVPEVKTDGRRRAGPAVLPAAGSLVGQVLTDVAAVDREFDYLVPAAPGSRRADRHPGARSTWAAGGWAAGWSASASKPTPIWPCVRSPRCGDGVRSPSWWTWPPGPPGGGPAGGGRCSPPPRRRGPRPSWRGPARRPPAPPAPTGLTGALPVDHPVTVRLPPSADATPLVAELAQRGPTLVVVPSLRRGTVLAERLRRAGGDVAVMPGDWAQARAGAAVVVGARAAAWAPCPGLAAVVVIDGHDQRLTEERAPTWAAVTVAAERARRAGVPCVVISACPTVELLAAAPLRLIERRRERLGWAPLEVVDRRPDDPRLGLYSERLVALLHAERRVVCVLNRTGRARLLACAACGEVARCERCGGALAQDEDKLEAARAAGWAGRTYARGAGPPGYGFSGSA